MAQIYFRILSTPEQAQEILSDFEQLLTLRKPGVESELIVLEDSDSDPELEKVWKDQHDQSLDESAGLVTSEIIVDVISNSGSLSGLAMDLAGLLTVFPEESDNQEPLREFIVDDPGTPRVPWFMELRH